MQEVRGITACGFVASKIQLCHLAREPSSDFHLATHGSPKPLEMQSCKNFSPLLTSSVLDCVEGEDSLSAHSAKKTLADVYRVLIRLQPLVLNS